MIIPSTTMQLRPVSDGDHEWLVELHNDPEVLRNLTNPQPITMQQHLEWWKSTRADQRQLRLIFYVNDERVGFTKFYNIDHVNHNVVLGADIHKSHRGKGHAKNMWAMMLNVSFFALRMRRASLTTAEFNEIGQRVYRGIGFKEEGRLVESLFRDDKYYDQICMYMLATDWLPPPVPNV